MMPPLAHTDLDTLARAFRDATLPKAQWTHEAHLLVAAWFLLRHDDATALVELRDGIRRLNAAHGLVETPDRGYHETITRFYVWAVRRALETLEGAGDPEALALGVLSLCGDRGLPLRYWSRERLFTAAARAAWVEPDLHPLG